MHHSYCTFYQRPLIWCTGATAPVAGQHPELECVVLHACWTVKMGQRLLRQEGMSYAKGCFGKRASRIRMSKKPLGLGLVSSMCLWGGLLSPIYIKGGVANAAGGRAVCRRKKVALVQRLLRKGGVPYVVCCKTQVLNVC